jgi:zinc transporter ZupT
MMMGSMPQDQIRQSDPRFDPVFVERERNRFAGRALSFLVLLNGAASLVLLAVLARAPESTVDPKFAAAMMFFSGGAIAALLSSFLAYINRTVSMEALERASLRRVLLFFALASVIGSGAAFLTGMNMVGSASSEKSSSHPKGPNEKAPAKENEPTAAPSERVFLNRGEIAVIEAEGPRMPPLP